MRSAARLLLIATVFFCSVAITSAQTQTKPGVSTQGATVSGKITIKGKPAPGVVVSVRRSEMSSPFDAAPRSTTDTDGSYRIANVQAGSYEIAVAAPGYVVVDSGDQRSRTLALSAGDNVEDMNFALVRGGVITGKVTDPEGRPAIEQAVNVYRLDVFLRRQSQPRSPIYPSTSGTTDDRGMYRIFGIPAGQYKVAVGSGEETVAGSLRPGRRYRQVFYPNVSDQNNATTIEVTEGSEAPNVDIALGPAIETFTATGKTIDEKFMAVPNVRFGLQRIRGDQPEFMNTLTTSNSQGDFVIDGLPPGKYSAFIFPEPNTSIRADAINFEIVDHDVEGLTIKLSRGAGISGVVVLETEDKRALATLSQLQISAYVRSPEGGSGIGRSGSTTIAADGSFTIAGLPAGTANLAIHGTSFNFDIAKGFSISRIERDGLVQARGIELKEGEQLIGIRVVVNYGSAILRGVVNLENGTLPAGGSIFVRISKPGDNNMFIRPPQVDARGHFVAEGIPPGVYEVSASTGGPGMKARSTKQQVTLQDGVATDIVMTIDLAEGPKPE